MFKVENKGGKVVGAQTITKEINNGYSIRNRARIISGSGKLL